MNEWYLKGDYEAANKNLYTKKKIICARFTHKNIKHGHFNNFIVSFNDGI